MTARERAIKEMVGLWVGDDIRSQPVESEDAEALLDLVEGAGLAIVDRELFDAMVAAVRAQQWASAPRPFRPGDELTEWVEEYDLMEAAHARAVRLLDERGE